MAEKLWYEKINRDVDWGGDESTNNLPVAGSVVQDFIKSELNDKIGVVYHDEISARYLCFAHDDDKNSFLADRSREDLILGSFDAPSGYKAKVLIDEYYKAVLINSTDNILTFGYEITNNDELFVDNIRYTVTITKNGRSSEINGTGIYGQNISINLDDHMTIEGTTEITIKIVGQISKATAISVVTYEVVNLVFESNHDVSRVYDEDNPLIVDYSIFGTNNIKYIDWYIDGEYFETDTIQGGTAVPIDDNKRISVSNMEYGVHNVQFRAYVTINGDNFYTDILYKEFIVNTASENKTALVAIETVIPKSIGISRDIMLYDVVQYESYIINYGVYNPQHLESIPVDIYIDDVLLNTVNAPNNLELSCSFTPNTHGNKSISFKTNGYERDIIALVSQTSMNIQENTNNLILSLSSSGKTNNDVNREDWSYGDYITTFDGFNWNSLSGWNDDRLVISKGMSITNTIKPLLNTSNGKTLEFEFETFNVTNDDAVICDLRDSNGFGLCITSSKAIMSVGYSDSESVFTNYKANENVRISFVLDSLKKLALIYVNGIVSGAISMTSNLSIDKELSFAGSDESSIKIKQIRIYDTQLSSEQILNNYILYRDSISEIKSLYNENDILDGGIISPEKVSNFIPVILLTGDQIFELETKKDTDEEIEIDVEYINKQDPTHQFKFYGGCCRIQGTSSAGYVRKNWRIYSKRKEKFVADVYDWQGNLVNDEKRRIAFKDGAVPVNCWTLKADFAESSGTHNTGVSTLWNSIMYNAVKAGEENGGYVCRTNAQIAAINNNYKYDCRTTVDGFPIVVFARRNDQENYIFMGKYNFNNDKSTENVFGFCDIPGFDDSYVPGYEGEVIPEGEFNAGKDYTYGNKMQCWEIKDSEDKYALFKTTEGWDDIQKDESGNDRIDDDKVPIKNWATGFEARYPDDGNEADTSDLKAFIDWLVSCDAEKFANEKKDHLDLWKIAAYYVYLYRFGAVDQVAKNAMLTSEDGHHWYFINYDNDTILGLDNSGVLAYPPTINRDTKSGATYAYAGRESVLWNLLESDTDFMNYYVPEIDNSLYEGGLTYENALKYFNTNQCDKWSATIYNEDANYKYIQPYTSGRVNELTKMHGNRKSHRTWWLSKRFQLMDAKFNNYNSTSKYIHLKLDGADFAEFTIKSSDPMYFSSVINASPWYTGVYLDSGESRTFRAERSFNQGSPIYIFSPLYIEELDLSSVSEYIYLLEFGSLVDPVTSARMKKLIIGGKKTAKPMQALSGLNMLTNLEHLDLTGVDYNEIDISNLLMLRTLILTDSNIGTLSLPEGCMIEELYINDSLKEIQLNSLPNLSIENIHGFVSHHIPVISISNSPSITNDFSYYYNWAKNANTNDVLNLSGIYWEGVVPSMLLEFKNIVDVGGELNLKGKIVINGPSIEEVRALQDLFGENCFTNNGELWISAPESVFIHGPQEIRSGDSQIFTTTIFSDSPGTVEWEIEGDDSWVYSIVSNPDNTGTLTTIEDEESDHTIILKAIHRPSVNDGDLHLKVATYEVVSKKTIYSTGGTISGNATIQNDTNFTLSLLPLNYNGDYTTEWSMTGDSIQNGSVELVNASNDSVTVKYINEVIFESCSLIATVKNKNGTQHEVVLPVTITDESVLMTSTSNPEVLSICYAQGWCENENVMYKEEAQKIIDIGDAFRGGSGLPGSKIKTFNELYEFKNIKSIPSSAFYQCYNLSEIRIPIGLEKIGSFGLANTAIKTLTIPNSVTSIDYTAFHNSPIESFDIYGSENDYKVIDGVLVSTDGELIKYPEGKTNVEYTINEWVKKINRWSIYNTKIRTLNVPDTVESCSEDGIYNNPYLSTINLGNSIQPASLSKSISSNQSLIDINVSESHPSLCSIDGAVYDLQCSTLWKYPEGRSEFVISDLANRIGANAVSGCWKLISISIPDNIETFGPYAIYNCQYLTELLFSNSSKLRSMETSALQLMKNIESITFPESLKQIGYLALASCDKLGEIKFLGHEAPEIDLGSFGSGETNWTGKNAKSRIIYVPSNATGFDGDNWEGSVFDENRIYIDSSNVTHECYFTLSQTL